MASSETKVLLLLAILLLALFIYSPYDDDEPRARAILKDHIKNMNDSSITLINRTNNSWLNTGYPFPGNSYSYQYLSNDGLSHRAVVNLNSSDESIRSYDEEGKLVYYKEYQLPQD